ncbi:hypothetical protein J7E83_17865 [Arthrobacter sp. ISL-48]|uniref:hypothetical protein n=1 Tax=Arthrobacter sp. ISL-48 TaxID=2819110 RepID=UPI001BE7C2D3|nr:hypothetical protein [Arthrobacter sp. ISL-48]MBT2533956.1 hypothetical protein [Arthrobacter sp. ISL-48]
MAVVVASFGAVIPAANATILYENSNYNASGAARTYGADNAPNVGSFDNAATSIRNFGYNVRFYQDAGYLGTNFTSSYDYNDLTSLMMNPWWNWNDEISSYQRV